MNSSLLLGMVQKHIPDIKQRGNGNQYTACCPLPECDDKTPSWEINAETSLYKCHKCGESGNGIKLARLWNEDEKPFYSDDHFDNNTNTSSNGQSVSYNAPQEQSKNTNNSEIIKVVNRPLKTLKKDIIKQFDLVPISKDKMPNKWDYEITNIIPVMWSNKYQCLAFPILNSNGDWIECHLHKYGKDKRSRMLGGTNFQVSLYPMNHIVTYNKKEPLWIGEGMKDVITLLSIRMNAISSTNGSGQPKDISLIQGFEKIIVCSDNDEQGYKIQQSWIDRLKNETNAYVATLDWRLLPNYNELKEKCDISDVDDKTLIDYISTEKEYIRRHIGGLKLLDTNKTPKKREYIVEKFVPKGQLTMLIGEKGSGKSLFCLQLAMSIANNEQSFLTRKINIHNQKVLFIDTEVGEDIFLRRISEMKATFQDKGLDSRFFPMTTIGRINEIYEDIGNAIEAYNPDIIFIDCLYNTTGKVRLSKNEDIKRLTDKIDILHKDMYRDKTFWLVHHMNKGGRADGITSERISGASAIGFWSENEMGIAKSTLENDMRLIRDLKARDGSESNDYFRMLFNYPIFSNLELEPDWKRHFVDEQKRKKLYKLYEGVKKKVN